ncbi:MAG: acyl-CoA dehydrogenase family protein [Nakamurella sp.]
MTSTVVDRELPTEEAADLLELTRDLVARELLPRADKSEAAGAFPRELFAGLGELGLLSLPYPEEFGGGGQPAINRLIVGEQLITAGAPIAAIWFADQQMGPTLIKYGTADQQAEFLTGILAGDTTWCIGMSEPNAGSDLASLTTYARRDGDDFVINGQKIWTSFGAQADDCYLICRTSSDGPPHRGISEVIVPMDTPGI